MKTMLPLQEVEEEGLVVAQTLQKHKIPLEVMVVVEEGLEHMEEGLVLLLLKVRLRMIGHCY